MALRGSEKPQLARDLAVVRCPAYRLCSKSDIRSADAASKTKALKEKFGCVEGRLSEGPYFAGSRFSLVDAGFAPVFRYFDVLDEIADFGVFSHTPKVNAWRVALAERNSVRLAVHEDYAVQLRRFLLARGGELSRRMAS